MFQKYILYRVGTNWQGFARAGLSPLARANIAASQVYRMAAAGCYRRSCMPM